MEVVHVRGYVYAIEYHIVWCVKYRYKILTVILDEFASEHGFRISEYNTDLDHVHLLVEASPQVFIPNMIKGMKGTSAREMFRSFPSLRKKLWGGHLWNPSYFIATVSGHTEEQIRKYIQSQKER